MDANLHHTVYVDILQEWLLVMQLIIPLLKLLYVLTEIISNG